MLIAYLTTDEVNQDSALHLAEGCGTILYLLTFGEMPLNGAFDAVIIDWDALPASDRGRIQVELFAGPLPCPVVVHGYNVGEDLAAALLRSGIAVHRRLEAGIFVQLRHAADQARALGPSAPTADGSPQPAWTGPSSSGRRPLSRQRMTNQ